MKFKPTEQTPTLLTENQKKKDMLLNLLLMLAEEHDYSFDFKEVRDNKSIYDVPSRDQFENAPLARLFDKY